MGRVVLVTGVADDLGAHVARRIAADPAVSRVVGVDRVGLDVAEAIAAAGVDTVVHASVSPSRGRSHASGASAKERNVIGTMQLLAACQRAPGVERLVVKTSAEVYGSSARDPAMFTEEMAPRLPPSSGFAKDMAEVEGYVRGFARRRPDVAVTILRNASTVGDTVRSPFADYLRLTTIPKPIGYDARIQVLHRDDLAAALHHAALAGVGGVFNLAGDGVLMLSQVIRRLRRPVLPLPVTALSGLGAALSTSRLTPEGFSADQLRFLRHGRGIDTTRMREVLGFHPAYTTDAAIRDFADSLPRGLLHDHPVERLERLVHG